MNKGTILRFIGVDSKEKSCRWSGVGLITGRHYQVVAGLGDGVPRNDGKLGAFIKDPNTFVVSDSNKDFRIKSFLSGEWEIVEEVTTSNYVENKLKSPVIERKVSSPPAFGYPYGTIMHGGEMVNLVDWPNAHES